jgi:hypothetical protein
MACLAAMRFARRPNLKLDPLGSLQIRDDLKKIVGGRVARWAKHLVKCFHVDFCLRGKLWKPDRRIDVIAQQLFTKRHLPGKKALNGVAKQAFPESGVLSYASLNGLSKISSQPHIYSSS